MPDKTRKYLLSDADDLRRIKFAQFRTQVPALILLAVAIALNAFFPSAGSWLYSLALALALISITAYLFIGFCFRYRQRIPLPPEGSLVSPIQGKVAYVRSNDDITLLNIRKGIIDSVELRSPHKDCRLEDGVLHLDTPTGKISFRFSFNHIQWFADPDLSTGNIIGMVSGSGSCTIAFTYPPDLKLAAGDPIDAGEEIFAQVSVLADSRETIPTDFPQPEDAG
jgi:hypothetical protein